MRDEEDRGRERGQYPLLRSHDDPKSSSIVTSASRSLGTRPEDAQRRRKRGDRPPRRSPLGVHALYPLFRPLLFAADPELAHDVALGALDAAARSASRGSRHPACRRAGRRDGHSLSQSRRPRRRSRQERRALAGLATLGFGFIEAGTVTPRAQPGNPRPRMFRIVEAQALVNRLGLQQRRRRRASSPTSTGPATAASSASTSARTSTRRTSAPPTTTSRACAPCYARASYVTINVSSPNTQGPARPAGGRARWPRCSRALTARARRARAAARAPRAAGRQDRARPRPTTPCGAIARLLVGIGIDGVIATNTTLARDGVDGLAHADEAGGLSGAPLRERSTAVLRVLADALDGALPIIGVGGILSAADARAKIGAGACARAALHGAHLPRTGSRRRMRSRARVDVTHGSAPHARILAPAPARRATRMRGTR